MNFSLFAAYIKRYWITSILLSYMLVTTIMKSYASIDFTIPCPIRYATGVKCFGCGLTTATSYLLRLDIHNAYHANPLVFIALPALAYMLLRHWLLFRKEYQ